MNNDERNDELEEQAEHVSPVLIFLSKLFNIAIWILVAVVLFDAIMLYKNISMVSAILGQ